jgi:hypothetical protein
MKIPTNVEIIVQEGLDNKLLMDIPGTQFSILGTKNKYNLFKVDIISRIGSVIRNIAKDISEEQMAILIGRTIAFRENHQFKKKAKLKDLIKIYKQAK